MTIEFEIAELLSSIGFENNLIIISPEREEFARHLECVWSDAVFETIRIADDPEEEEGRDLFIDFHIHSPEEIEDELTGGARLGIDEIIRPKEGIARMVIDIDDGRILENISILLERFTDTMSISAITDENGIEFLCCDFRLYEIVDSEPRKEGSRREFIDNLDIFSETQEREIHRQTRSIRIGVDTLVGDHEERLTSLNNFGDFLHFVLRFTHFCIRYQEICGYSNNL